MKTTATFLIRIDYRAFVESSIRRAETTNLDFLRVFDIK